ncbi:uncharacterized protein [Arachis hypogaea]|uniref:uncharacterized protein n=1 Tax=Arachis hypogaea TaxID=3818 RepID=UPI003B20F684
MSNKAFGMILELLKDAFEHARIPSTVHDAKKVIRKLGLTYKKIDTCPDDCMLYQGNDQELTKCKWCGTSRWKHKTKKKSRVRIKMVVKKNGKPQAAKILRYFPFIPRLQRLYMSSKTAVNMLWYKRGPNSDGMYRHPRDVEAWKSFDKRYPDFSGDLCSVRLTLASDGFNPFENMSSICPWFLSRAIGYGKKDPRQQTAVQDESPWKKRIIFFELSYWENNGLRHNLDVMHIEKNVCDNIIFTILNEKGQCKLSGLKSHDCHILMKYLLPISLRNALPAPVSSVLADLSSFFRQLCSKSIDPQQLPLLQDHMVHTLCHMKMIFPPSFFTVIVHLIVHLVEEVRLGVPVYYRWMYPIERYLDNVESRINRPMRVDDRPCDLMPDERATMYREVGKAVEAASFYTLTPTEKFQAHRHILVNCPAVKKFLECIWANTTSGRGIKQDSLGHTLVNFSHPIHTGAREDDESYILVSETLLVYYMDDAVDQEWSVVVHVNPRDMFDIDEDIGQCCFELPPN